MKKYAASLMIFLLMQTMHAMENAISLNLSNEDNAKAVQFIELFNKHIVGYGYTVKNIEESFKEVRLIAEDSSYNKLFDIVNLKTIIAQDLCLKKSAKEYYSELCVSELTDMLDQKQHLNKHKDSIKAYFLGEIDDKKQNHTLSLSKNEPPVGNGKTCTLSVGNKEIYTFLKKYEETVEHFLSQTAIDNRSHCFDLVVKKFEKEISSCADVEDLVGCFCETLHWLKLHIFYFQGNASSVHYKFSGIYIDWYPINYSFDLKNAQSISNEELLSIYHYASQKGICVGQVGFGFYYDFLKNKSVTVEDFDTNIRPLVLSSDKIYFFSREDYKRIRAQDEKLLNEIICLSKNFAWPSNDACVCLSDKKLTAIIKLYKKNKNWPVFNEEWLKNADITIDTIPKASIDKKKNATLFIVPLLLLVETISWAVFSQTTGILQEIIGGFISWVGYNCLGRYLCDVLEQYSFGAKQFLQLHKVNIPQRAFYTAWNFDFFGLFTYPCIMLIQKIPSLGIVPEQVARGALHAVRILISLFIFKSRYEESMYAKNYSFFLKDLLQHLS